MPRTLVLAIVVVVAATSPGHADGDRLTRADALFVEGKALLDTDLHAACAKFAASLELNGQAIGTLLNVALCDERLGRIASAFAHFTEARDMAIEQGLEEHKRAADEHLKILAPQRPTLTFEFTQPPRPETRLVVHDRVISLAGLADVPIDPGEHVVVVSAPGYVPHELTVRIAVGEHHVVKLPPLERAITARSSRRTIGKITLASGIATLGAGVVLGVIAGRRYDQARTNCVELTRQIACDADAFTDIQRARTLGNVGTVIGVAGVVVSSVGAYLWLRGGTDRQRAVTVVPMVGGDVAGVAAVGHY